MILGAHAIIYSKDAAKDRALLRDLFKFAHVDAGDGWLIFGLPPSEVAVHPSNENDIHELYLLCDDIEQFMAEMKRRKIACSPAMDHGWGILTQLSLPGGGKLGIYEPRHPRPEPMRAGTAAKKARAPKAPPTTRRGTEVKKKSAQKTVRTARKKNPRGR